MASHGLFESISGRQEGDGHVGQGQIRAMIGMVPLANLILTVYPVRNNAPLEFLTGFTLLGFLGSQ